MVEINKAPDKDQTVKEDILRSAEIVFQKWGLNKTTMEDIAHEANKGKSTLYYYYKSKEEIFESVITIQLEQILAVAKESVSKISSAKEKMRQYIIVSLQEIHKFSMIQCIARDEMRGNKEFIEKIAKKIKETEMVFLKEIILSGMKSKEIGFPEKDLNDVATTCLGIIKALDMYLLLDDQDNVDPSKKVEIMASFIANGL